MILYIYIVLFTLHLYSYLQYYILYKSGEIESEQFCLFKDFKLIKLQKFRLSFSNRTTRHTVVITNSLSQKCLLFFQTILHGTLFCVFIKVKLKQCTIFLVFSLLVWYAELHWVRLSQIWDFSQEFRRRGWLWQTALFRSRDGSG